MTSNAKRWAAPMALYLLGIFMGAIDTGIITPARPIISIQLGVDESAGIWMITIYTLAYAAAIPIMGKLADRNGRKPIYLISIALFGVGSLLCGLSQDVGSFEMLIIARAIQAIGGGGILPIATAEIGTSVPEDRRGMALGLVGAVYGIANIFGASAGSLVLQIAGNENWQWIFYINIPITIGILIAGVALLPNHKLGEVKPIDVLGSLILVGMILSLLYGLGNIDYLDAATSIASADVWPFLALFLVLLPALIVVERRAKDPVLNLSYFTDRGIALTLLLSLLSGVILMGVVFVPAFAENSLRLPAGSGGYAVIALGLTSGIGAPLSGRLTDKFGPRLVLGFGVLVCMIAAATLVWWAIPTPSTLSVMTSLCLIGLGLGFVVGSPLNYMMLERTDHKDSSSALATLSLMRSIGTTLAPAIMVGFLAQSGTIVQDDVTAQLPTSVAVPALPHAAELKATLSRWEQDPDLKDKIGDLDLSALDTTEITIDITGEGALPDELLDKLRNADVTTIVAVSKEVARAMFAQETPATVADITNGVQSGIDGIDSGLSGMNDGLTEMDDGLAEMDANLPDMTAAMDEMAGQLSEMDEALAGMTDGITGIDSGIAGMRQGVAGLSEAIAGMDEGLAQQRGALAQAEAGIAAAQAAAQGGAPAGVTGAAGRPPAGVTGSAGGPPAGVTGTGGPPAGMVVARPLHATVPASAAAEPARARTASPSATATATSTPTASATPSPATPEPSATVTPTPSVTPTATPSATPTSTATPTPTTTPTPTPTATASPTASPTATASPTPSATPTSTPGGTPTPTASGRPPGMPDPDEMQAQLDALRAAIAELQGQRDAASAQRATLQGQLDEALAQRAELVSARAQLRTGRAGLATALDELSDGRAELLKARHDLADARAELVAKRAELETTRQQMVELKAAVPGAFDAALDTYLSEIDQAAPKIEAAFQGGLNQGFRGVYLLSGGACALALVTLTLVGRPRR